MRRLSKALRIKLTLSPLHDIVNCRSCGRGTTSLTEELMKVAELYERNGQWFFQTSSMLPSWLWIATPPVIQINANDPTQAKGEAAREALRASRQNIPVPADTENVIAPLLEKAGVKSWSTFIRKAKCVGLQLEEGKLTLTPHQRMASRRDALEGIRHLSMDLSAEASSEEIGAALEVALARCE